MDAFALLRTIGSLAIVLAMLAGALWVVRRYDIKLPGRIGGSSVRRVELVERLAIDPKRSVALIRRDGREHLILIAPDGHVMIESGISRDGAVSAAVAAEPPAAIVAAPPEEAVSPAVEAPVEPKAPAATRTPRAKKAATPARGTTDALTEARFDFGALVDLASAQVRQAPTKRSPRKRVAVHA